MARPKFADRRLPGRRARDRRRARAARRDGGRDRRAPRGAGRVLLSPLSLTRRAARGIVATHGARFPTGDHRRARRRRRLARRAPHAAMGAHPSRRSAPPAALSPRRFPAGQLARGFARRRHGADPAYGIPVSRASPIWCLAAPAATKFAAPNSCWQNCRSAPCASICSAARSRRRSSTIWSGLPTRPFSPTTGPGEGAEDSP